MAVYWPYPALPAIGHTRPRHVVFLWADLKVEILTLFWTLKILLKLNAFSVWAHRPLVLTSASPSFRGSTQSTNIFYKNTVKTQKNAKKRVFYEISYKFWNRAGGKERFFAGDTSCAPLLWIAFKNRSILMTFQKKIIREIDQLADFLTFFAFFDHFWASISPKILIRPQRFFGNS